MKFWVVLFLIIQSYITIAQEEPYLTNQTYTYEEAIQAYKDLAKSGKKYCRYFEFGLSDYGLPLSLFLINKSGKFEPEDLEKKSVFLINNGIHPGEPEGIDACIKMSKEYIKNPSSIPDNVIIAIIPIYNIGGAHNRNCCSRANQNGPEEYGFRGNAKNLDLNRDFIKADSKNTRAFYKIFHFLKPDVFIDTHTSNGADYQYVMTLITSQLNKMSPVLSTFVKDKMNPFLYDEMLKKGFPMIPYVTSLKQTPDSGIVDFLETPRYSTGYTNLFNCISFVAETHMLKPFEQRVNATYDLLKTIIDFTNSNYLEIKNLKNRANDEMMHQTIFPLNWRLDTVNFDSINFLGYTAEFYQSEVTGLSRLSYNREKPYAKKIPYYNEFVAYDFIQKPKYYIIPQAWDEIIPLLKDNQVSIFKLSQAIEIEVEQYSIVNFTSPKKPYEGHYLHEEIEVDLNKITYPARVGDYIVPVDNLAARFIIETLEPKAADSYLAWNFFDSALQQKEWFSSYVFEDEAPQVLANNPALKKAFEEKKLNDKDFAENAFAQLYFIYKGSSHYEPSHNKYPVLRCMNDYNFVITLVE